MGFLGTLGKTIKSVAGMIPGIGNTISGAIDIGSSILGDVDASNTNQANISQQKDLMQYQKSLDMENWQQQFDLTNAYNTPSQQAARLREAGVNPAVAFGGGTAVGAGNSDATPQSGTGTPDYSGLLTSGFQSQNMVAQSIRALAEAGKVAKETGWIDPLSEAALNNTIYDTINKEKMAELRQQQVRWNNMFGDKLQRANLGKAVADYWKTVADIEVSHSLGEFYNEAAFEKFESALLRVVEREYRGTERDLLETEIKYYGARVKSEIRRNNAAANQSDAIAENQRAQARTEEALRPLRATALSLGNQLRGIETADNFLSFYKRNKGFQSELENYLKDLEKVGLVTQADINRATAELKYGHGSKHGSNVEAVLSWIRELTVLRNQNIEGFERMSRIPLNSAAAARQGVDAALSPLDNVRSLTPWFK